MTDGLDNILGQIKGLGGLDPKDMNAQMQGLLNKQVQQSEQTIQNIQKNDAARSQTLANPLPKPAGPNLQSIPQAPVQQFQNPAKVFGDSGTVLAVMASLFTRHPLVTALNAGAAAMNAFHQGDQERLKLEHQNWESSLQQALDQNQMELDKYHAAIEDRNMSVADRMAEIEGIAAANQDQQVIASLRAGNLDAAFKILDARQKSAEQLFGILQQSRQMGLEYQRMNMEQERLKETERHNRVIEGGGGATLDPDTVDMLAQQYLGGDKSALQGLGYGRPGMLAKQAVLKRAAEIQASAGGPGVTANRAEYNSLSKALSNVQTFQSRTELSMQTLQNNMNIVKKYMEPGLAGETPAINRWIQAGRRAVAGDPDVTAFDVAIRTVAREYARIMSGAASNAQLPVSASEDANEILSADMNSDQINAALDVMNQDIDGTINAANDKVSQLLTQIGGIGRGSPASPAAGSASGGGGYTPGQTLDTLPQGATPAPPGPNGEKRWQLPDGSVIEEQ